MNGEEKRRGEVLAWCFFVFQCTFLGVEVEGGLNGRGGEVGGCGCAFLVGGVRVISVLVYMICEE